MKDKTSRQTPEVVLFGAGNVGEVVLRCLNVVNFEVAGMVDNNAAKWGLTVEDVTIHSPEYLLSLGGDVEIVVTMIEQDDVICQLESMGFVYGINVFSYKDKLHEHELSLGKMIVGLIKFRPITIGGDFEKHNFEIVLNNGTRYFLSILSGTRASKVELDHYEKTINAEKLLAHAGIRTCRVLDYGTMGGGVFIA